MRGGKRIVHKHVAECGQLRHKGRVVLFLAWMKARVLKTQNVAGPQLVDRRSREWSDAIFGECNGPPYDARNLRRYGSESSFGFGPLGRPKCERRTALPPLSAISMTVGA